MKPSLLVCGPFAEMISSGPWCWTTTSVAPDKASKYNKPTQVGGTGQSTKQANNTEQTLRKDCNVSRESHRGGRRDEFRGALEEVSKRQRCVFF